MIGPSAGGTTTSLRVFVVVAASVFFGAAGHGRAEGSRNFSSGEPVAFEIPAQPLQQALEAYSAVTGLDVFYTAVIAERRNSNAAIGAFTPRQAIQIMLAGSGYVARVTVPGALVIVAERSGPASGMRAPDARFDSYFSRMQTRIGELLCDLPDAGDSKDVLLRIWLSPSGDVAHVHADVVGDAETSGSFANVIARARFAPPPPELPQPVTLVVFPMSKLDQPCAVRSRTANDRSPSALNRSVSPTPMGQAVQR